MQESLLGLCLFACSYGGGCPVLELATGIRVQNVSTQAAQDPILAWSENQQTCFLKHFRAADFALAAVSLCFPVCLNVRPLPHIRQGPCCLLPTAMQDGEIMCAACSCIQRLRQEERATPQRKTPPNGPVSPSQTPPGHHTRELP